MKTLAELEIEVRQLPRSDKEALLSRLEDMLEDELEFTDEFKAHIAQSKADIAARRELDEAEWVRAAARSPAYHFLNDAAEDLYSPADGRPLDHAR